MLSSARPRSAGPEDVRASAADHHHSANAPHALVVEDDPQAVEQIEDVLVSLGHERTIASTLTEARRCLAVLPDYILLDIAFPTRSKNDPPRLQNTENFLEQLAKRHGDREVPVIVMSDMAAESAYHTVEMMRQAVNLATKGAWDFIDKPFATAGRTLDRVIKKVLELPIESDPEDEDEPAWLTVTEAATLLTHDLPGLEKPNARARVSAAANRKEFATNGKSGRQRRIDPDSFSTWRLAQRDRDLEEADCRD